MRLAFVFKRKLTFSKWHADDRLQKLREFRWENEPLVSMLSGRQKIIVNNAVTRAHGKLLVKPN